jgi:hypothetical protein
MDKIDLDNLNKEDFLEMAKWCHHLESQNRVLVEQLREAKASLLAVVQQRNSLNAKLQTMVSDKINTIDISSIQSEIVSNVEFINPEMYAVPKERLGVSEKADRI